MAYNNIVFRRPRYSWSEILKNILPFLSVMFHGGMLMNVCKVGPVATFLKIRWIYGVVMPLSTCSKLEGANCCTRVRAPVDAFVLEVCVSLLVKCGKVNKNCAF